MTTQIDEEKELKRIRKERAERLERDAFAAELDAAQYTAALDGSVRRPGLADTVEQIVSRAEDLRCRATAAHERAGTTPDDFAEDRRQFITSRVQSLAVALIQEREWLEAPDVYIDNPEQLEQWIEERKWSIEELEQGLRVLRDKEVPAARE